VYDKRIIRNRGEEMSDLIEALQILAKYDNPEYPTLCEHDEFHVMIDWTKASDDDKKRLNELGFIGSDGHFLSFKYGSC
jgi:hypothetical protein